MLQACHVAIQRQQEEQEHEEAASYRNTASGATTPRQHQDYTTDIHTQQQQHIIMVHY